VTNRFIFELPRKEIYGVESLLPPESS